MTSSSGVVVVGTVLVVGVVTIVVEITVVELTVVVVVVDESKCGEKKEINQLERRKYGRKTYWTSHWYQ